MTSRSWTAAIWVGRAMVAGVLLYAIAADLHAPEQALVLVTCAASAVVDVMLGFGLAWWKKE